MPLDFPSSPTNGQSYAGYVYDSSLPGWRNANSDFGVQSLNTMGLKNIVPGSIVVGSGSATVNGNGSVDFSAISSISINNVFSSTYDSYKILFRTTTAGANALQIRFRLRAGGTDNSATQYSYGVPLVSNVGNFTSYTGNGATFFDLGNAATSFSAHNEISVSKPNNSSVWTSMNWTTFSHSSSNTFGGAGGGYHSVNYSADGFTIFPASSTITGSLEVFGFTS